MDEEKIISEIDLEQGQEEKSLEVDTQFDDRARRMGWVPKEQFRGDPEKWISADKFVERGEQELPIMRERLRALDTNYSRLEKTLEDLAKVHKKTAEREYARAMQEIVAKQREAVKIGDEEAFERLEEAKQKVEKPEVTIEPKTTEKPEFTEWKEKNEWFNKDPELKAYAVHISGYVQSMTGLPDGKDLYERITKEVKERFPHKFTNQKRIEPSTVSAGSNAVSGKSGQKTKSWNDLPGDAKAASLRLEKYGVTKEQYVEQYEWE